MNKTFITFTPEFKREYIRLRKKHASLDADMKKLVVLLEQNPTTGIALGNNAFKIRLAIRSKNKGKSGGGRIITYFVPDEQEVYLLTIYDKSEQSDIDLKELKQRIDSLE